MPKDTGWMVTRLPPGFVKIVEGFRRLRGKRDPVAQLVYSDGLVAVSVFIEPIARRRRIRSASRSRAASTSTSGSWTTIW